MVKKKNPQDTTLRNVRAAKKREQELKAQIDVALEAIAQIRSQLAALTDRVTAVETPR